MKFARRLMPLAPLVVALIAGPAGAQTIGQIEEVRQSAFATPPASTRVRVAVRYAVVPNELLETARDSAAAVRFRDDTVFRLGPDSQAKLDQFVYDPNASAGQMVLSLGRGGFRFISGRMPKEGVRLVTPNAIIGIRGTDFVVLVRLVAASASAPAGASTTVVTCDGQVTIAGAGGGAVVNAGQSATLGAGQASPSVSDGALCDRALFMGALGLDGAIAAPAPGGPPMDAILGLPVFVAPIFQPPPPPPVMPPPPPKIN